MRRWASCIALTVMVGGCDLGGVCDEVPGLCGGEGGDEYGEDGDVPPPGEDEYGEDGGVPPPDEDDFGGDDDGPLDPCLLELQWCLDEGGEDCEEILQACDDVPPPIEPPDEPPVDPCLEEHQLCLETIGDDTCDAILHECYGEPPSPPGGPADACFEELELCLDEGVDPQHCDEALLQCLGEC